MTVTVLGVPTSAGSHNAGQEDAPAALRAAGLLARLGDDVVDLGDRPATPYVAQGVGVSPRDVKRTAGTCRAVAEAVRAWDGAGRLLVLGGDCTITVGVVSGLRHTFPDLGIAYVDGDIDLSVPGSSDSGVLDTMVLSHLFGEGVDELSAAAPSQPVLDGAHLAAVGFHPVEAGPGHLDRLAAHGALALPHDRVRALGPEATASHVLDFLPGAVLLHFDLDVIDTGDFPLANFPHMNGGLDADTAFAVLRHLAASPRVVAVVVTEVNPHHDPDGSMLVRLVDELAAVSR